MSKLIEAVECYIDRKNRNRHPDGSVDKTKWYPSETEKQKCCESIRQPSRSYPWSLQVHCRTKMHVEHLYGLESGAIAEALTLKGRVFLMGSTHPEVLKLLDEAFRGVKSES
jgi:hypothetical protein